MINYFFKRKTLWSSEREELAEEIKDLCSDSAYYKTVPTPTSAQLRVIQEVTNNRLDRFTIYEDKPRGESQFLFRMISLILIFISFLAIPLFFIKWVLTGDRYLSSKSKLAKVIDTIYRKGGF